MEVNASELRENLTKTTSKFKHNTNEKGRTNDLFAAMTGEFFSAFKTILEKT